MERRRNQATDRFDVVVIGSGFSGSLLAWILAKHGRKVLLLDRQKHPRFAIGESSTPTADFLLAHLAERWQLPELAPLACWGTWKAEYPEVTCGKKRGFSYYQHRPQCRYTDSYLHDRSLLVAASVSDQWSDTHWLRSSVDTFLCQRALACGTTAWEQVELSQGIYDTKKREWSLQIVDMVEPQGAPRCIAASWVIDASGGGGALAHIVDNPVDDDWMLTKTRSLFGHFVDVGPFRCGWSSDDPFCGDDAAQHHLLDRGWLWMLRMDNGITSVGLVEPSDLPVEHRTSFGWKPSSPCDRFNDIIEAYPSLQEMMQSAKRVAPQPQLGVAARLSRCRTRAIGPGWAILPVTYGFVDPLHSTGIAHSLSGVQRIAEILLDNPYQQQQWQSYDQSLRKEITWIDRMVAGCYLAQPSFEDFVAYASFYFVAAIEFEKQLAADPSHWPQGFLQANDSRLLAANGAILKMLEAKKFAKGRTYCLQDSQTAGPVAREYGASELVGKIRHAIAPWNNVGLLDPERKNRISHSAAPKYARIAQGGIG